MTTKIPDLVPPRFGIELADGSTRRHWAQFRQVKLWQAIALQLHMDPDKGPWDRLGVLEERGRLTPEQPFGDRLRQALLHIEHGSCRSSWLARRRGTPRFGCGSSRRGATRSACRARRRCRAMTRAL